MSKTSTPPPVRIYILWHPGLDRREEFRGRDMKNLTRLEEVNHLRGLKLARRLYYWFRLENMEGIPVYFRSAPANPEQGEAPLPIEADKGVRNYVIALIDANMVASPDWRYYVADYVAKDSGRARDTRASSSDDAATYRVLPVAIESVAYNMPESMRNLNFIRHIAPEGKVPDDGELIARITEVICRDMRNSIHAGKKNTAAKTSIPEKLKIFLSHAKADDTKEAIALKQYIQRETQCEAFFDETDIASGYDYGAILQQAISRESAGLIVIQGDNYADRPWCRKEIRDFLKPAALKNVRAAGNFLFFVPPAVVVQTMKGKQIGRTIPELGYSPCVGWQADHARFVVTTLLREILFGLFYRKLAERVARAQREVGNVFLNRSPDPVMISRIMADDSIRKLKRSTRKPERFVHPGYGLSKMEKDGLSACFPGYSFSSLSEQRRSAPEELKLPGKIIAISVGNSDDVLARGLWDEHTQEVVLRLTRPLLAGEASLLYGGNLPESFRPAEPWKEGHNFTSALLQLLISERIAIRGRPEKTARLYVPTTSVKSKELTAEKIAQWTDVCTFVESPSDRKDGVPLLTSITRPLPPREEELELLPPAERRKLCDAHEEEMNAYNNAVLAFNSIALSSMRAGICGLKQPLSYTLPDSSNSKGERLAKSKSKHLKTFAHILLGGKMMDFSGIVPGIFEEALCAFKAKKPVFLIPVAGGAAALLASWLCHPPEERPRELTVDYYKSQANPWAEDYARICAGYQYLAQKKILRMTPQAALDQMWERICDLRKTGRLDLLFHNRLSNKKNRELLLEKNTRKICELVWEGLASLAKTRKKTPAAR